MGEVRNPDFFKRSIREKIEGNRERLGKTGEYLLTMLDSLGYDELVELNDMSLLLMYLDYVEALKSRKQCSDAVKERLDKSINFSLISTFDGSVMLDMDEAVEVKEEIREQSWFNAHNSGGAFVFEDYGLELAKDFDINEYQVGGVEKLELLDEELLKTNSVVKKKKEEEDESFYFDLFESLIGEREALRLETEREIAEYKKKSKEVALDIEITGGINTQLKEFTEEELEEMEAEWEDAFDNLEDENEYGLEPIEDSEEEGSVREEGSEEDNDIDEGDLSFESEEEEEEFEDYCKTALKEKWRGLTISRSLNLEFLDSQCSNVIDVFVNRGMIKLPEDLLELSDEMLEFLFQGDIIDEIPERKKETMGTIGGYIGYGGELGTHTAVVGKQQLFKNKSASERVEAADKLRKRLGLLGEKKLMETSLLEEE